MACERERHGERTGSRTYLHAIEVGVAGREWSLGGRSRRETEPEPANAGREWSLGRRSRREITMRRKRMELGTKKQARGND